MAGVKSLEPKEFELKMSHKTPIGIHQRTLSFLPLQMIEECDATREQAILQSSVERPHEWSDHVTRQKVTREAPHSKILL